MRCQKTDCRFPGKKFIENQNENTRRLQYNPIEMSDMRTLNYTFFQRCSHVLELTRNSDVVESMYSLSYIPETVYDKSHLLSLDDTSFTESIVDLLKWFKTNSAYSGYGLVKQENEKKDLEYLANVISMLRKTQNVKTNGLKNKVVVVAGGSRGIGEGIAVRCAMDGAHVVILENVQLLKMMLILALLILLYKNVIVLEAVACY